MKFVKIKPLNLKAQKITSLSGMARGLMFSKKKNLLFEFRKEQNVGIHMLFVFFPIIAVWIDKNKKIKNVKRMKPFVSFHEEKAKYILEIPFDKKLFLRLRKLRNLKF